MTKYGTIYMDPAWHTQAYNAERSGTPRRIQGDHYDTMTLEEMKLLPVADYAAKDCAVFMWVIDSHFEQAFELARHWGFRYSSIAFVWKKLTKHGKAHFGMGKTTRKGSEICLLFFKGKPPRRSAAVRQYVELFPYYDIPETEFVGAKVREHSRKPDEFYPMIEALYDGPRLEMFSRTTADGWDVWGKETGKFTTTKDIFA